MPLDAPVTKASSRAAAMFVSQRADLPHFAAKLYSPAAEKIAPRGLACWSSKLWATRSVESDVHSAEPVEPL